MLTVIPIRHTAGVEAARAFHAGPGLQPDGPSDLAIWARRDAAKSRQSASIYETRASDAGGRSRLSGVPR